MAQMAQMAQVVRTEYFHEKTQTIAREPEAKHDLTSPRFVADPHAVFRRMRAGDPAPARTARTLQESRVTK